MAVYLSKRPLLMLLLIMLFGIVFRVCILYPSYANGLPSGFDTYIHAASAYFIRWGGLPASPTSPIYPPTFLIFLALLYQITGVFPVYLIAPVGIAVDVLCAPAIFYITRRLSGGRNTVGLLAALFQTLNPITLDLLILGTIPTILGILELLTIIAILVSDLRSRVLGIVSMGLLGGLIFLTNILVGAFYVFFVGMIVFYEIILGRGNHYAKPLFLSLLITAIPTALFYLPNLSYFYVGVLGGSEYFIWNLATFIVLPILMLPIIFLYKRSYAKKYTYARNQNATLLRLWYLTAPVMALVFVWQAAVLSRMWHFISFPAVVVLAMIVTAKFRQIGKSRGRRTAAALTATLLIASVVTTFSASVIMFNTFYENTPERMQLVNWIETNTTQSARFCTEEEYIPTQLGWYVMGLTGRIAYESLPSFSEPFEVGTDIALHMRLANNITALTANTTDWISAVRSLQVSYVILLANKIHTNYAAISSRIVFATSLHAVYNVTEFLS
ncbi:MAG: hypothetical protein WED04_12280 [Promethearchaeati archaeon SRVP18_Atabeyarchaeia-1]